MGGKIIIHGRKKVGLPTQLMNSESNRSDKTSGVMIVDKFLEGLSQLLDQSKAKIVFQKAFDNLPITLNKVEPFYIRYKPETSCIIAYTAKFSVENELPDLEIPFYAKVFSNSDFPNALVKAESHRWIKPKLLPSFIPIPELDTILYLFPNDCVIDGLRILSSGKKIQRELYEYYDQYNIEDWSISDKRLRTKLIRFKPERRAVIKCRTKAVNLKSGIKERIRFYMKIYADNYGEKVYSIHNDLYLKTRANSILDTPKPMLYNKTRNILFMERARGTVLSGLLNDESYNNKHIERTALTLFELHKINLPSLNPQNPDSLYNDVITTTSYLTRLLPELETKINDVKQLLEKQSDLFNTNETGFVHGDCHPGQFLSGRKKTSVIDFDRSFAGDRLIDVGNFIAALKYADMVGENKTTASIQKMFVGKYEEYSNERIDSDRLSFWTSYGLFKMAVKPFRDLKRNWPQISSEIINECLKLLT